MFSFIFSFFLFSFPFARHCLSRCSHWLWRLSHFKNREIQICVSAREVARRPCLLFRRAIKRFSFTISNVLARRFCFCIIEYIANVWCNQMRRENEVGNQKMTKGNIFKLNITNEMKNLFRFLVFGNEIKFISVFPVYSNEIVRTWKII